MVPRLHRPSPVPWRRVTLLLIAACDGSDDDAGAASVDELIALPAERVQFAIDELDSEER